MGEFQKSNTFLFFYKNKVRDTIYKGFSSILSYKGLSSILRNLRIKLCVLIITILEWFINNRYMIPLYKVICLHSYLSSLYPTLIQLFPFISLCVYLFYRIQFIIAKDIKVAFIADGNRRYLKKMNKDIEQVKKDGLKKMSEIVEFCTTFKVPEVGFFCFSIKNFKRSDNEIQNVLQLLTYKSKPTSCKIQVIGNMDLLPVEISDNMRRLVDSTKGNNGTIVNLFIAYSSQDEVENGIKFQGDLDLIVRTSGERRLSDFCILQCCRGTNIFFCDFLWPEITVAHLVLILWKYKLEQIFFRE